MGTFEFVRVPVADAWEVVAAGEQSVTFERRSGRFRRRVVDSVTLPRCQKGNKTTQCISPAHETGQHGGTCYWVPRGRLSW